jgi:hypothetical protein
LFQFKKKKKEKKKKKGLTKNERESAHTHTPWLGDPVPTSSFLIGARRNLSVGLLSLCDIRPFLLRPSILFLQSTPKLLASLSSFGHRTAQSKSRAAKKVFFVSYLLSSKKKVCAQY